MGESIGRYREIIVLPHMAKQSLIGVGVWFGGGLQILLFISD